MQYNEWQYISSMIFSKHMMGSLMAPAGEEPVSLLGHELPVGAPEPVVKPAEKSDVEKRLAALEAENVDLKKRTTELSASERYWADRAARTGRAPVAEETESDDEPEPTRRAEELDNDTGERLLDDLSKDGRAALKRRGFLTQEEVDAEIQKAEVRITKRLESQITKTQEHGEVDRKLSAYPELQDPKSELFIATREIWNDMVGEDKRLKDSPATLLAAAKLATQKLKMSKLTEDSREETGEEVPHEVQRRRRVAANRTERESAPVGDDDRGDGASPMQRQVLTAFEGAGFKVGSEVYRRNGTRG